MFGTGLQFEEIDHIDESDLNVRKFFAEEGSRSEGLLSRNVPGGSHHHVRFTCLIIAGPIPDADAFGAMDDGLVHTQILQMLLLVADDYVHVVLAAEAMIGNRQQAVDIGGKVNACDISALVDDHIQKSGILMSETVVILAPHG